MLVNFNQETSLSKALQKAVDFGMIAVLAIRSGNAYLFPALVVPDTEVSATPRFVGSAFVVLPSEDSNVIQLRPAAIDAGESAPLTIYAENFKNNGVPSQFEESGWRIVDLTGSISPADLLGYKATPAGTPSQDGSIRPIAGVAYLTNSAVFDGVSTVIDSRTLTYSDLCGFANILPSAQANLLISVSAKIDGSWTTQTGITTSQVVNGAIDIGTVRSESALLRFVATSAAEVDIPSGFGSVSFCYSAKATADSDPLVLVSSGLASTGADTSVSLSSLFIVSVTVIQ